MHLQLKLARCWVRAWKTLKNKEKKVYVEKEEEDKEAFQKRLEEAGLTEEEWNQQKIDAKEAKARRKAEKDSQNEEKNRNKRKKNQRRVQVRNQVRNLRSPKRVMKRMMTK